MTPADWPPLLRESDRDAFIGWVQIEAEDHQPDRARGGCTCGFCAWSIDHVIVMAIREVWDYRAPRSGAPSRPLTASESPATPSRGSSDPTGTPDGAERPET